MRLLLLGLWSIMSFTIKSVVCIETGNISPTLPSVAIGMRRAKRWVNYDTLVQKWGLKWPFGSNLVILLSARIQSGCLSMWQWASQFSYPAVLHNNLRMAQLDGITDSCPCHRGTVGNKWLSLWLLSQKSQTPGGRCPQAQLLGGTRV